jgi:hypothetical protein
LSKDELECGGDDMEDEDEDEEADESMRVAVLPLLEPTNCNTVVEA